jgi:colanic acid/amylovoran biosynthesis glycosyltransferase
LKNPSAAIEAIRLKKYQTVAKNLKLLYFGLYFCNTRYNRYDVVHCHFGMNGLIGCYLKACGFCKKVVTTFHGADINSYVKKYGKNIYKTLYKNSNKITTNTEFTKSKIMENGGPKDTVIIPEGLFFSEFYDKEMGKKIPNSVLTVGRLEEKKGYFYSLEAIARAKALIPSIQYYIIGDGSLYDKLINHAKNLNIIDNCRFLKARTNVEVKKYYKQCEIFMLSSITASNGDMEGQGLVLQEAQASGLPVISTLHNGIPDGILRDKSGFLVPEKDSHLLAEKIILLLQNDELRRQMGKAGVQFVQERYDMPVIIEKYNKCYFTEE